MADLQIRLDAAQAEIYLGKLARELQAKGRFAKVVARAQNRVIMGMRTETVSEIRKIYNAPAADVRKTMTVTKADKNRLQARLTLRGAMALELVRYGARETRKGVSVRILRASKAKPIQPGGERKILATKKRGVSATWIAKGHVLSRVEGKDHPVMLWGPSFMTLFSREEVIANLRKTAEERFMRRVKAEADWELAKIAGAK